MSSAYYDSINVFDPEKSVVTNNKKLNEQISFYYNTNKIADIETLPPIHIIHCEDDV